MNGNSRDPQWLANRVQRKGKMWHYGVLDKPNDEGPKTKASRVTTKKSSKAPYFARKCWLLVIGLANAWEKRSHLVHNALFWSLAALPWVPIKGEDFYRRRWVWMVVTCLQKEPPCFPSSLEVLDLDGEMCQDPTRDDLQIHCRQPLGLY